MLLFFWSALALAGSMSTTECNTEDGQFIVSAESWVAPGTQSSGNRLTLNHNGTVLAQRDHTHAGPPEDTATSTGQLVAEWIWPSRTPDPRSQPPVPGGYYVERYHVEATFTREDGAAFSPDLPARLALVLMCASTHYPPPPAAPPRG